MNTPPESPPPESLLLDHIRALTADQTARHPHVMVGPGDDCAVLRPTHAPTLLTVDQLVSGVHFLPPPATPTHIIARKAVARSVSDIAAMGGTLRAGWALATACLPPAFPHAQELTDALHRWAAHWGFPIVGGDIASGPPGSPLVLTLTIGAHPHPVRGPVLRSTARPGDLVFTTGRLGGSFREPARGRHLSFEPRLPEALWLCDRLGPRLHAMIDLSDGLGRDAGRIAAASSVRIELDAHAIPIHPEALTLRSAIADGEDYELLFTAAPDIDLPSSTPGGTPITRIGRVTEGSGCFLRGPGDRTTDIADAGFDHGRANNHPG